MPGGLTCARLRAGRADRHGAAVGRPGRADHPGAVTARGIRKGNSRFDTPVPNRAARLRVRCDGQPARDSGGDGTQFATMWLRWVVGTVSAGSGGTLMTCNAEIKRRYETRDDAWGYLASRGFVCHSSGWENGRWAATVVRDGDGYDV